MVGKQGIRIDGSHYIAPEILPGEAVFVRMDPSDMGRAYVFDEQGEAFRAVAICPELAGVDPAAAVAQARAAQKRLLAERTADIRAEARKIKPRDMVEAVARQAALTAGKLVELPRRAQAHTTPALDAAGQAHRGGQAPEAAPLRPEDAARMAAIEADLARPRQGAPAPAFAGSGLGSGEPGKPGAPMQADNIQRLRKTETQQWRFRRWLAIGEAIEAGQEVSTEDAIWFGSYRETGECRGMQKFYADFGEDALR